MQPKKTGDHASFAGRISAAKKRLAQHRVEPDTLFVHPKHVERWRKMFPGFKIVATEQLPVRSRPRAAAGA